MTHLHGDSFRCVLSMCPCWLSWCHQDTHKSTTVTCLVHLVGGMLAVGTNTGKVMVCSATGLQAVHDLSPADSRQGTTAGAMSPDPQDRSTSYSGGRGKSHSGAVQLSSPGSAAATPTRARSSIPAPWQDLPADTSKRAAQQVAGAYAVQALVQRGRGFVAAGSTGDVFLFEPASGAKG